jgi:hypothetical protein
LVFALKAIRIFFSSGEVRWSECELERRKGRPEGKVRQVTSFGDILELKDSEFVRDWVRVQLGWEGLLGF